jgi:nitrite reductase/ring-hydroxylating ferredoxin subunit
MNYFRLATTDEFENKKLKTVSVMGKKIGIIKQDDQRFYAIEVGCKHQGADLTQGKIENNIATCPRHGWKYDLETGACLNHDSPPLRKHKIKIEDEKIHVSMTPID